MTREQRIAMKAKRNEALVAQVQEIIKAEKLTQAAVSKLTNVNAARLNQWLKGTYAGDNDKIEQAVQRWLDSRESEEELSEKLPADTDWVRTPSAASVLSAMSFAQMAGSISVVYGGAGIGKTTAIRTYANQAPNVWVVTATPSVARPGPVLTRIAQALNLRTTGALHMIESNIIERIQGTRGLLVIDEAQHLCHRALDSIRSIHDATGVGVCLAGNEIVYAQLTGGTRAIGFAQLFSRVAKRVRLSKPTDADITAILDAWQITDKDTRKFCMAIGKRPGALRGLSQTLRLASLFASNVGEPLSLPIIRDAWADLGGDL